MINQLNERVGREEIYLKVTTDLHHACTTAHTGTSASAPLAAGIVALTLQVREGRREERRERRRTITG